MPFAAIALAWLITTCESTVFEKLFHEDHPIGGGGTAIGVACPCASMREETPSNMPANAVTCLVIKIELFDIRYESIPSNRKLTARKLANADYFVSLADWRNSTFQPSSDSRLTAPNFCANARNSGEAFFTP